VKSLASILVVIFLLVGCSKQASVSSLAGNYYRGDGTGYNIYLNLELAGTYKAEWHGCLGIYGKAEGSWSVNGKRITLRPTSETDMLKGHLRELHIVEYKSQFIFVPDLQDTNYQKYGPDTLTAFFRQKK
jgi:hypothetical protein